MKQIICLSTEPWSRLPGRTQQLISRMRDTEILSFFPSQHLGDSALFQKGLLVRPNVTAYALPAPLPDTARLRMAYPDLPLAKLGQKFDPPVSKAGLSHRFKRIQQAAQKLAAAPQEENNG